MSRLRRRSLVLALALGASGCVTTGQYETVVAERDELTETNQRLEASVAALGAERDRLASEVEDQREQGDTARREIERSRGDCEAQLAERTAKLDELHATYEGLIRDLEGDVAKGNTQIEQLREGLRMSLPAGVLFESGSADLSPEGERVLADVAKDLRRDAYASHQILVEGHTDGVPVRGILAGRYPTNWELAGARAARVVRALEQSGVDAARLAAVSRGAAAPLGPDETPEGRAANRRIEIRLLPLASNPASAAGPAPAAPETPNPAP